MEIKAKAGLNKVGKVLAASVALGACAAYAAPENNWQGGSENTEVSRTSNWSQGYVPTANMRFLTDSAGKTVTFDQLVNMTDYMWLGSTTAGAFFTQAAGETAEVFNPVVWTATHETNGIHQTAGSLRFADFSNQNAGLVINGGTYTTDAEVWIGKNGGTAKVVLNEGTLASKGDFLMSTDANGASYLVVGSGDPTRKAKVTVPTGKWAKLTAADYGKGVMTLKAGGEFHCGFLQMNSADSTVIFDGGTFVKDGDVSNTIGSLFGRNQDEYMFWVNEGAKLVVTDNGGTLDIGNTYTRTDFPLVLADGASSGVLTKKGSATLLLSDTSGFAGGFSVDEGVLAITNGTTLSSLSIAEGAYLAIKGDDVSAGDALLTVSSDISGLSGRIICQGAFKSSIAEENGKWVVRAAAYEEGDAVCTYWTGMSGNAYSAEGNWSNGLPTAGTNGVFLTSATLSDMTVAEGVTLVVEEGVTVTLPGGAVINGSLAGKGTVVQNSGTVTLAGDNSDFEGEYKKLVNTEVIFNVPEAGSAKAKWTLYGDMRTKFATGTLQFGELNWRSASEIGQSNWYVLYCENSNTDVGQGVTIEVGALNTQSQIGSSAQICKGANGSTLLDTLRKVGTGDLTLWFDQYNTVDMHEGTVSFMNNNGPSHNYTFTGGTMNLKYVPGWAFLDRIHNSTGPVSIDTCGVDVGLYQKGTVNNTNTGGLTKLGDGILTIWADLAYTGPTTVRGGKLFIKGGVANLGGGTVTVDEGATLNLYADHITFTDGEPVVLLNGQIDADSASRVVVSGVNKEITVSAGENVTAVSAAADNSIPNRWVGIERDNWTTASCWSKGVPQADQSIAFDYDCHVGNMNFGYVDLNKIIIKAGVEVEFLCQDKKNPSVNVNGIEIDGDGEATIALYHAGIQSRSGRLDTPSNLNLRMTHTTTDSWLRNLNVYGKILGEGILRPYGVYFYGDNSQFNGTITVQDAGSHICDVAASATNAVWDLQHDIALDIMEGTFKMGALNCKNQRVWYTKNGSTATIEVGHKNIDFGTTDSKYFWGPETYDAITVPELVFKKVGTGKWSYSGKGIRHIVVEEGELALGQYAGTDTKFDNNSGFQLDTLVVKSGATLSGSLGTQPILSLAMESGSTLKTEFNETVEGEVVTYSCVCLGNVGAATLGGVQLTAAGTTPNAGTAYTVLSANSVSGTVVADIGDPVGDDKFAWCAKVRPSEVRLMYCNPNPGFAVFVR